MSQQSNQAQAFVTKFSFDQETPKKKEPVDTAPCEYQPLGVDDEEPSY